MHYYRLLFLSLLMAPSLAQAGFLGLLWRMHAAWSQATTSSIGAPTEVQVKTLTMMIPVPIDGTTNVLGVKQYIQREEGVPVDMQRLVIGKVELDNSAIMRSVVQDHNTNQLQLILRLRGG